jgi:hypothetical protein
LARIGFSASRTLKPAKSGTPCLEAAGVVHRLVERQLVFHADLEVLDAVRGRRVHDPRAGLRRHVLGEHHRDFAIEERMAEHEAFERDSGGSAPAPTSRRGRNA